LIELTDWFATSGLAPTPWLVVGKGPTFARRHDLDLTEFNLLSLNHVVTELAVDVAHVIDLEVVAECADALESNCRWLLIPRYPSVGTQPGTVPLEDHFDAHPVLRRLDEAGRLVWYNVARTPVRGDGPVIGVKYFSAEAAIEILARSGARTIRSLGVDGGRAYASEFDAANLLVNGQPAFDLQFRRIEAVCRQWDVDYAPLVPPLRIYIGTDPTQTVAHRVLEHSIRAHASIPTEIVPMLDLPVPLPRDPAMQPRVPFSFSRFLIPELAGHQGRALYLDSDMLVFGDIAELATYPFDGKALLCTSQPETPPQWKHKRDFFKPGRHAAVMLYDCSRLDWRIDEIVRGLDEGRYDYDALVSDLCIVEPELVGDSIPIEWNHLERYEPGVTKLLHYTVVPTQPWRTDANPLGELWMDAYRDAVAAGAILPDEVEALIAAGHVKPSLAEALRHAGTRADGDTELELALARHRITELEGRLTELRTSRSYRVGDAIVRTLRRPRDFVRRRVAGRRT